MTSPKRDDHHLFDHLVVLMLENRSFDNLCGYLYEHDEPKRFIPDEDRVFRGVAGRDDLVNDDGGDPPREYRVQHAPWKQLKDMFAPYPNAGEFYAPNINRQVYGSDTVSGNIDELPTTKLMRGFVQDYIRAVGDSKKWDGSLEATPEVVQQIMNCFPPEATPVLSTLAKSFAISDAWFSSAPTANLAQSFVRPQRHVAGQDVQQAIDGVGAPPRPADDLRTAGGQARERRLARVR